MVLVVHKKDEDDQFLIESTCNINLDELVRQIVDIQNARMELRQICTKMQKLLANVERKEGSEEETDNLFTRSIAEANAFLSKVCYMKISFSVIRTMRFKTRRLQ